MAIAVESFGSPDYPARENLRWHMLLRNRYISTAAELLYWMATMCDTDSVAT
jgi:hypothetical protein